MKKNAPPTIRRARAADLPAILDIFAAAFEGTKKPAPAKARRTFDRMRSYPDYGLYVAVSGGVVAGVFALLIMDNLVNGCAPSAVVEDVAVHPRWQGRGIGRRMMLRAMQLSREAGCYKMALSSNRARAAAHRFYESLGFEKHGYSFLAAPR